MTTHNFTMDLFIIAWKCPDNDDNCTEDEQIYWFYSNRMIKLCFDKLAKRRQSLFGKFTFSLASDIPFYSNGFMAFEARILFFFLFPLVEWNHRNYIRFDDWSVSRSKRFLSGVWTNSQKLARWMPFEHDHCVGYALRHKYHSNFPRESFKGTKCNNNALIHI